MEMPQPTEHHRRLAALAGHWTGTELMHPSPWLPKGGEATGIIDNRIDLEGFVMVQDYRQERDGAVTFRGHGVVAYEPQEECYVMHWWDSYGSGPSVFRGRFEDDTFTLTAKDANGFTRATWRLAGADGYEWTFEGSQDGESWGMLMEGSYRRSS